MQYFYYTLGISSIWNVVYMHNTIQYVILHTFIHIWSIHHHFMWLLYRQEFLVSKVIKNIEDERNDVFGQSVIAANFVIHEVDNDFEEIGPDTPARKNN